VQRDGKDEGRRLERGEGRQGRTVIQRRERHQGSRQVKVRHDHQADVIGVPVHRRLGLGGAEPIHQGAMRNGHALGGSGGAGRVTQQGGRAVGHNNARVRGADARKPLLQFVFEDDIDGRPRRLVDPLGEFGEVTSGEDQPYLRVLHDFDEFCCCAAPVQRRERASCFVDAHPDLKEGR